MTTTLDHFRNINKGDQISLVLAGIIVDGTFDGLEGDCVVLVDAKSSIIKKKNYTLKIPVESIYAWGEKQKKEKKKDKKKDKEQEQEQSE
ncbi:MAG: hypothetical protein IPG80_09635 [Anaerolineales bacterium]|uniref:hypothetical protein n=1 Tax=Candidatus Villigracilis vicinus TaxID=3140679 RepID=UPI0031371C9D|nr:hypothetical protein [Anaerolineales bacterium]